LEVEDVVGVFIHTMDEPSLHQCCYKTGAGRRRERRIRRRRENK
jgi:hypothetical protein